MLGSTAKASPPPSAARHNRFEPLSKKIAVVEPAEPAIGQIEENLVAKPPLGAKSSLANRSGSSVESGSLSPYKRFAFELRDIIRCQPLPGYALFVEVEITGRVLLAFVTRPSRFGALNGRGLTFKHKEISRSRGPGTLRRQRDHHGRAVGSARDPNPTNSGIGLSGAVATAFVESERVVPPKPKTVHHAHHLAFIVFSFPSLGT
jgi:hypothetical protein